MSFLLHTTKSLFFLFKYFFVIVEVLFHLFLLGICIVINSPNFKIEIKNQWFISDCYLLFKFL